MSRFVWHVLLSLGGIITTGLLVWHGLLIQAQIQRQDDQNELFRAQIEEQRKDNLIVRRAQLLDTIYTEECEDPEDPCRPKANPRAVQEAILAFVEIERGRGERANLTDANLNEAKLIGADLRGTTLGFADLTGANLGSADLREALLGWADLTGANLFRADLSGAILTGANLNGAHLNETDLTGANLRGTHLSGAHLNEARNLTPEQLAAACGDEDTTLPEGVEMPEAWPCRWERHESGLVDIPFVPLDPGTTSNDETPVNPDGP